MKKAISIILSLLIVCSAFSGMLVSATTDNGNHTYTVYGVASFLGKKWDANNSSNDMKLQLDGTYKITYTGVDKSNLYSVNVIQDHDSAVKFGNKLDENDPYPIEFSVPKDNSKVDVILKLTGTRYKDKIILDGIVQVFVNDEIAPSKVVPQDNVDHYVAGDAGLCNGISWDAANIKNKMVKNKDNTYEITFGGVNPKEDGSDYEFKVTTNGEWNPNYGYSGKLSLAAPNNLIRVTEPNSTVKIVLTSELKVRAWVNNVEYIPVETTTTESTDPIYTTNEQGETNGVLYSDVTYTGPRWVKSKRYFLAMPKEWSTFPNATACAYWLSGTDACYSWKGSHQIMSTPLVTEDGMKVYYVDVPDDVDFIMFNNGIEGSTNEKSVNYGKAFSSENLCLDGYKKGESYTYPDGIDDFSNMIYVIKQSYNYYYKGTGNTVCGGEWYYFHDDGKWDTSSGTQHTVPEISVNVNPKNLNLPVGDKFQLQASCSNLPFDAKLHWVSDDTSVATVDNNGVVTSKGSGCTKIYACVTNAGKSTIASGYCQVIADNNYYTLLEIPKLPDKMTYFENEKFDPTGLEVYALTDFDERIKLSSYDIIEPKEYVEGENVIEVKYKNLSATFFIYVVPIEVANIKVTPPIKTEYYEGENLDTKGMNVIAYYNNGTSKQVDDYTISGYDSSCGEKKVQVNYKGKKDVFNVLVKEKEIKSLSIKSLPNKMEYYIGDKLNLNGLEVFVNYVDGSSKRITDYKLKYNFNKVGDSTVTLSYKGFKENFIVKVIPNKVSKIKLSRKSIVLVNGKSKVVEATVSPSNSTNKKLKWTTSNSKVATVNASGKITAKGKGTATIKVMALDGSNKYATLKVTVKQPVTSVKLNKNTATLKIKGKANQKSVTLKTIVLPKNADNKSVTWKSSNTKVATVNSKGKVIAKKKGTCYIIATAKDGSKKFAKCKVIVS